MFSRFSLRHVRDAFPAGEFERGRRCFEEGRVTAFEVADRHGDSLAVTGQVRGSGGRLYTQEIDIEWDRDGALDVFSTCSCATGFDCRHVVAVCLTARRYLADGGLNGEDGDGDDRLRRWLARVDRAGSPGAGAAAEPPGAASPDAAAGDRLIYVLHAGSDGEGVRLELRVVRPRKSDGQLGKGRRLRLDTLFRGEPPSFLTAVDDELLRLLAALCPQVWNFTPEFRGRLGALTLERLADSGRCAVGAADGPRLERGDARPLSLGWQETGDGRLRLAVDVVPAAIVLTTEPVLYIDPDTARLGPADMQAVTPAQLAELKAAPTLLAGDAVNLARLLANEFPALPVPVPAGAAAEEAARETLTPCLTLAASADDDGHELRLAFRYGLHDVPARPASPWSLVDQSQPAAASNGKAPPTGANGAAAGDRTPVRVPRDLAGESAALDRLRALGFRERAPARLPAAALRLTGDEGGAVASASRWSRLLHEVVPGLEAEGWQVSIDDSFRLRFLEGAWHGAVEAADGGGGWFSLRFDLDVDGRRVPLLPLLMPLLEQGFDGDLPERVSLPLADAGGGGDHDYVDLPGARLKPFLDVLRDLYERAPDASGGLPVSRYDGAVVARLAAAGEALVVPPVMKAVAERLAASAGVEPVAPPRGLNATLRAYQQRGLDWLQFLARHELGGILADDMGLGKTLQTLAHLLAEHEAGRLDRPALIVAPTSLVGNWRREAARFAPALRVLVLHGPERHARFDDIGSHDVVLTTYPLLPRDGAVLAARDYHVVILDEAQMIKNPRTKAATILRSLEARQRLCLTGTPMENHLGELWSQLDFLMPGLLGSEESFRLHWQRPIEEEGDDERRALLAARVAPFVLRRRKQDVLPELPPKTEILRTVALEEDQASLYESVRLAMEDKVREAIAEQGLARSRITMLDALLKLRQVCCDPRLLSLESARGVRGSAKLDLLMDMLPELLESGRRVLLFSQFTSMLALIETALAERGIPYGILTGQTRDRDGALAAFRRGEVDLQLVSLKAGGVGLNLTEADTVILYDPWWNPAVEAQAADRAHRIGQTRPVFVYRLVAEGTVEERILELQDRKRDLAEAVLNGGDGEGAAGTVDAEALRALLDP